MVEKDFITVAEFNNSYEPQLAIAKSMLKQAGIDYYVTNENFQNIETVPIVPPTPLSLQLRVDRSRAEEAIEILESIAKQ